MLATTLTTARDTLLYAAGLIRPGLEPQGRAAAVAATFRQLADSPARDLPLTPADLVAGLEILVAPRAAEEPAQVTARRKTCEEIAELLRPVPAGEPRHLASMFQAVARHFARSGDPRQAAIMATAAREAAVFAAEIEAATA
jgi:hypothetical protein